MNWQILNKLQVYDLPRSLLCIGNYNIHEKNWLKSFFLDRHSHGDLLILPWTKVRTFVEAILYLLVLFFFDFLFSMGIVTSLANKGLANKG